MSDDKKSMEGKLVESIKVEGLGELAQQFSELGFDLIYKEGLLKDIPIIGMVVSTAKAIGSFRDLLYLKKLLYFLKNVGEATQQDRERFIEENCKDNKQFEEAILLILEQTDNMNKSGLIGKIFKACIQGKITYEESLKLSDMVNRAYWSDLQMLLSENKVKISDINQSLLASGLFHISGASGGGDGFLSGGGSFLSGGGGSSVRHKITRFGEKLIEISKM